MSQEKPVRRLKTYASAQGYAYQYYFVGERDALPGAAEAPAAEFVFDVTSDRTHAYAVSVFLSKTAVNLWEKTHGRPLTEAEKYGAAKMRLFGGFDDLEDMQANGRRLVIDGVALEKLLAELGVD